MQMLSAKVCVRVSVNVQTKTTACTNIGTDNSCQCKLGLRVIQFGMITHLSEGNAFKGWTTAFVT